MEVLVAQRETGEQRKDDFGYCVAGELVRFSGITCDCPGCGCDRAMAGLASSKGTTMFRVEDRPDLTVSDYHSAFLEALKREGWLDSPSGLTEQEVADWADEHLAEAARFKDGDALQLVDGVLTRR